MIQDGISPAASGGGFGNVVQSAMEVDNKQGEMGTTVEGDPSRKRDANDNQAPPAVSIIAPASSGGGVIPPSPSGKQDPKRVRTGANAVPIGLNKSKNVSTSAGPFEGHRREQ